MGDGRRFHAGSGWRSASGFYGWWMVAFCSVTFALSAPGQTSGVSVFIDPLMETLDLTRSQVSTAYLVGTLASAATMPRVGRFIDQHGARTAMMIAGTGFGVVLAAMSGVRGLLTLTLGFAAIRLFGQGSMTLVSTTAVAPWFIRRRGFAIGVVTAAGASMMSLIPIGSAWSIRSFGWRPTWLLLAGVVWLLVLPIARFALLDRPSVLGQQPDGDAPPEGPEDHDARYGPSHTRAEALRTPIFWVLAAAVAAASAIGTALSFHQIDLLGERGLSDIEAAANFLPQTVGTLATTLAVGALIDRFPERWILVFGMGLLAAAMIAATRVSPGVTAIGYALLLGAAASVGRTVEGASTPKLYGLAHLGEIRGVLRLIVVASSAVGPVIVSVGRDVLGSYAAILTVLLVIPVVVIGATLATSKPSRVTPT